MKERIKNIVIILLVFGGLVLCAALIDYYLPKWMYYTFLGLILVWVVWDSSKPEEKQRKHYWLYHYVIREQEGITIGVLENDKTTFSLSGHEFDIEKSLIFSAVEIDKETYDIINNTIKSNNRKL